MNLRDFTGLKNKSKLHVLDINNEYGDYYAVKLKLRGGLSWRPGAGISSFKGKLINMQPGDSVALRGPFGWFVKKDDTSPLVFIAGGVALPRSGRY